MRVHVSELRVGDQVISDIFNDNGIPVLSANKFLQDEDIKKINLHKVDYIEIEARSREQAVQETRRPSTIQNIQPSFTDAIKGISDLFTQVKEDGVVNDNEVNDTFEPLVQNFKKEKDIVSLLLELNSKDDYTFQHSVQVGMIAHFIGKWTGSSDKEAYMIGKAGYLHDIGKSQISLDVLQKPDKLTDEEYEEIKKHTLNGYEILKKSSYDPPISLAALQHHERIDGSGYPLGVKGDQIHRVAKIVAVADIYSAMISSRVYQKKQDQLRVLKELYRLSFNQLDPYITHTFIKNMIPNFINKKVIMKTGETGTIIMNNPNDFFRPLIRIEDNYIDLSSNSKYQIEIIYN